MSAPVVVETFAGPGGGSTGLRAAGWDGDAVGVEWDEAACATARAAGHERVQADVAAADPLEVAAGRPVAGFVGTPPCPTFSTAGKGAGRAQLDLVCERMTAFVRGEAPPQRVFSDERTPLCAEPARWIVALRPRWVLLEQVPAVLPIWQHLAVLLRGLGYRTWAGVLDAECYGVPQTRDRAILIADLDAPVGRPEATHQRYVAGREPQTGPDLFGDPLPPPVSMAEALGWGMNPRPYFTLCGAGGKRGGPDEQVGGSAARAALYAERDAGRWIVQRSTVFCSRPGNLRWLAPAGAASTMVDPRPAADPAHTITGKDTAAWVQERPATTVCGDPRIGSPGHRDREGGEPQFGERSVRVTVAEAGILQSFPPNYPWQGTKTAQYRQVGDSLPPLLAAACIAPRLAVTRPGAEGWAA